MRALLLTGLLCLPLPTHAETISQEIGRSGIAPTLKRLIELPLANDEEALATAMLTFLIAIEGTFQTRWSYGLTDRTGMVPLLRLPLDDNPAPLAFDPGVIRSIFTEANARLADARTFLARQVSPGSTLTISLGDLWFDVNSNAARDAGENLLDIAGPALLGWRWEGRDPATPAPVVSFDNADMAWTSAYAHLLMGICDLVLAYDPTEPITRILAARATMDGLGLVMPDMLLGGNTVPDSIDIIAIILASLDQTPDAPRMASAQQHFLAMIADNREFWARVETETDNVAEWLPNDRQQSALGLVLPPGTGVSWLAVLADAEAILTGKKLVPYWRFEGPAGVNVARLFTDPRPVDIPGWIQGWAAVPYLEPGPKVSPESWWAFESMVSGEAMLFSIFLN